MLLDNTFFMNLALKEAWKYQGLTYPNPTVGCCVVGMSGEVLAVEAHHKAGAAHAEVNALKSAYYKLTNDDKILNLVESSQIHSYLLQNHNDIFKNTSLYTTLEPCSHTGKTPSCANLISSLSIAKVYVGSLDTNLEAANGNKKLRDAGIEVTNNILNDESDNLLLPFTLWQKNNFVFFKWAQRLNGTTDGEAISSKESRKNVHAMRNVCDLLVIGGNTVRVDRPTLDARLVNGRAPDILIVSREKEFDMNIPLFDVKNRRVYIENNFSKLCEYKNVMIEGTSNMYELAREYIDMSLCYIAPKIGGKEVFKCKDSLRILHSEQEGEDLIMWLKREV